MPDFSEAIAALRAAAEECDREAVFFLRKMSSPFLAPEVVAEHRHEKDRHELGARMYRGAANYLASLTEPPAPDTSPAGWTG